jgi:hypothetical protein
MTFFRSFIQLPKLALSAWRPATAFCLVMAGLLGGCGGGGGGASSSTSPVTDNTTPTSNSVGTVKSGVYLATSLSGLKAITLIINSDSVNSSTGQFFALQFNTPESQPQQPDIYSGSISGLGTSAAKVNSMLAYSTYVDTTPPKTGSTTFTSLTQGELKVDATEEGNALQWGNAKNDSGINIDTAATSSSLLGPWTGSLYFPTGGSLANYLITFAAAPTNSDPHNLSFSATSFGVGCRPTEGKATPYPSGNNLYSISLKVPNDTQCDLNKSSQAITLTGLAYITTSPVAGKKRLQWVAINSDGRGLSFRADK